MHTDGSRRRRRSGPYPADGAIELGEEVKAGYLQKWTNYIRGYRTRYFVLDSNGNLSYYRTPQDIGTACRGTIRLNDARILAQKDPSSLIISSTSDSFHLKTANDSERAEWLAAIERARHAAVRRAGEDEDEVAEDASRAHGTDLHAVDGMLQTATDRFEQLVTGHKLLHQQVEELARSAEGAGDRRTVQLATILKTTSDEVRTKVETAAARTRDDMRRLQDLLKGEASRRKLMEEQLEQLARQHSALERAAVHRTRAASGVGAGADGNHSEVDAISEGSFYDAEEYLAPENDKKSTSSGGVSTTEEDDGYLHAQIKSSDNYARSDSTTPTPTSPPVKTVAARTRRSSIPEKPNLPLNLWSVMKNCIGKDLSKIPMPVNFSEPLSVLQRITEDFEYAHLLDTAATKDSLEQLCYVAAWATSSYSTTCHRTTKPFNPLLGETYECDRTADLGWRSVAEQVSHHPPAAALYAEGNGWNSYQDFTMATRFRGKYLSVTPEGTTHAVFPKSGNHYFWRKVTTTVHNIIVGKLWIDNHGEMEVVNQKTGEKAIVKFHPYSYFSRDPVQKKVTGIIKDAGGTVRYVIQGTWDKYIEMAVVTRVDGHGENAKLTTGPARRIWTAGSLIPNAEKMYNFTRLAIELNEPEEGVAPTDSRLRHDQRLMEQGRWPEANTVKTEVEERQRTVRKRREQEAEAALQKGAPYPEYEPAWFKKEQDEASGTVMYTFTGDYWRAKERQDFARSPQLYMGK